MLTALTLLLPLGTAAAQDEAPAQPAAARPSKAVKPPAPPPQSPPEEPTPAEQFASLMEQAILLEAEAQNYERRTLGSADIERLGGTPLKRRQRIDADREGFEQRLSAISLVPLTMPVALEGAELTTKEQLALSTLASTYARSRDPRSIRTYIAANQAFLSTVDWIERDRAVRLRDTLMESEAKFLRLAGEALVLLRGGMQATKVERMVVTLRQMSPDVINRRSDVSSLILKDPELRNQVVREALEYLQKPSVSQVPVEDSSALMERLATLQTDLVEASQLSELREELTVIEVELTDVNARLQDRGVNSLSPTERKETTIRWSELSNRQSTLQHQWMRTPPAQHQLDALLQAQVDVIRRSMFELGTRGALFANRFDVQREVAEARLATPYTTWELLEEQASLIDELDGARPAPGLLDGLPPRVDPIVRKAQAALVQALKQTHPELFNRMPMPTKPKNVKQKPTTTKGTTPAGTGGSKPSSAGKGKKKKGWN